MADDYNLRAAKGQALNLAVSDALHHEKSGDINYILTKYVHYYDISQMIQGLSIEEIKNEVKK